MKNIEKVIKNRINKIELNNIKVLEYNDFDIKCVCNVCNKELFGNYRNLSYKNFKCKYCSLYEKLNDLLINNIEILKIEGSDIYIECENGHKYKQDRRNLLAGKGCKECYLERIKLSIDDIKERIKNIHGDSYKYNFSNFENIHTKIEIKCNKGHVFKQKISNHLQGKACPICRESMGERIISKYLDDNNIKYIKQYKFDSCYFINKLKFDFYLPELNTCLEYDGIQHYKPIDFFGGKKEFDKVKKRDKIKNEWCEKNKIRLIRISYKDNIDLLINKLIILQS